MSDQRVEAAEPSAMPLARHLVEIFERAAAKKRTEDLKCLTFLVDRAYDIIVNSLVEAAESGLDERRYSSFEAETLGVPSEYESEVVHRIKKKLEDQLLAVELKIVPAGSCLVISW